MSHTVTALTHILHIVCVCVCLGEGLMNHSVCEGMMLELQRSGSFV